MRTTKTYKISNDSPRAKRLSFLLADIKQQDERDKMRSTLFLEVERVADALDFTPQGDSLTPGIIETVDGEFLITVTKDLDYQVPTDFIPISQRESEQLRRKALEPCEWGLYRNSPCYVSACVYQQHRADQLSPRRRYCPDCKRPFVTRKYD